MKKTLITSLILSTFAVADLPVIPFKVSREIPHDLDAFTQGLLYLDGYLWESTGSPGGGTRIRKIEVEQGRVLRSTKPDSKYFGEGLATDGLMLYQLSWKQQLLHIFTYPTVEKVTAVPYRGEGWGLAVDDKGRFLMSNGSDSITVRNKDFQQVQKIAVTHHGKAQKYLNELEWHDGHLYANIWYCDSIAEIDIHTGKITGFIDLSELRKSAGASSGDQVVNGIASAGNNKFWVTGKFWPKLYLIELYSKK